ncbi:DUF397 domain-containing protein [Amycolatopsis rubida]|uniref:DUF397 domain-containing protein n=1 Tax=Amycolatopsis rubida TaxID=112413 RepID=A0A1I6BM22_9PSEU|nr:DUF397 domain-containing protein [Amycolatopsis rubida]SFQ81965.1 protein of unknown function [Amycolatopsis rubida]
MRFDGAQPRSAVFDPEQWRRSSFSGPDGGTCVEVNLSAAGIVGVRDSKLADSPILLFSAREWHGLLDAVRAGAAS